MSGCWTDRLSEYLDDELPPSERAALEAHVAVCPDCAALLDELERVVATAAALEDRPPERDLWPAIAARIGGGAAPPEPRVIELPGRLAARPPRRFTFTIGQLAAAAIALVFLSGGAVWLLRPDQVPPFAALAGSDRGPDAAVDTGAPAPRLVGFPLTGYDDAVADLESVLAEHRDRLDTTTVRVLEQNLRTIDQAIEEARRALAADPANPYLNGHLVDSMQRKIELLRRVATLASAET